MTNSRKKTLALFTPLMNLTDSILFFGLAYFIMVLLLAMVSLSDSWAQGLDGKFYKPPPSQQLSPPDINLTRKTLPDSESLGIPKMIIHPVPTMTQLEAAMAIQQLYIDTTTNVSEKLRLDSKQLKEKVGIRWLSKEDQQRNLEVIRKQDIERKRLTKAAIRESNERAENWKPPVGWRERPIEIKPGPALRQLQHIGIQGWPN